MFSIQNITSILAVLISGISLLYAKKAYNNSKSFYKLSIHSHITGVLSVQVLYTGDTLLRLERYKLYKKRFLFFNSLIKHVEFNNYTLGPDRKNDIIPFRYITDSSGNYPELSKLIVYGSRSGEKVKLNLKKTNKVDKEKEVLIG